ncbi:MAG: AAA family ATPase [Chloroflexota bacterium]|nr:AAA family ATPase [Chloroflexota bacterium]
MYKSFRVKNFRCFKDLQINDLGRVNLIAGKNNTGKTALLEAMYLLTKPLKPGVWANLSKWRELHFPGKEPSKHWGLFFYDIDTSLKIEIEAFQTDSQTRSRLTISQLSYEEKYLHEFREYAELLRREGLTGLEAIQVIANSDAVLDIELHSYSDIDSREKRAVLLSHGNQPVFAGSQVELASVFLPVQGRPNEKTAIFQFSRLDIRNQLPTMIEMLQEFEPGLSDLRLSSPFGEMMIWGRVNGTSKPLKLMGEGMNRVAHLIITMMTKPKSVIFIDEIENGIHHSAQCKVWKAIGQLARELDIQVFATTHSLEMIRAAYEAFAEENRLDEFRYHRLDCDHETGDIEAVTYNKRAIEAVATFDFDFEVRG